jgi:hypothetical protein
MSGPTDKPDALRGLPTAYLRALSWRRSGMTDEEIAARLEVPIEALPSLFRIAEDKLARLSRATFVIQERG